MADPVVLIVDDEEEICELVSMYLNQEHFRTHQVHDGKNALKAVDDIHPDLILLDVLMPGMDGVETCTRLRTMTDAPIIFMSCQGEETEKITALDVGGDDYIVKPFGLRELLARVKAHLRRRVMAAGNDVLTFGPLKIDFLTHSVFINRKKIKLSGTEFEILTLLAKQPGVVFSSEEIFNTLWSKHHNDDSRTVLVHVSNLRRKIEPDPAHPSYVLTVWGLGYQFNKIWTTPMVAGQSENGLPEPEGAG